MTEDEKGFEILAWRDQAAFCYRPLTRWQRLRVWLQYLFSASGLARPPSKTMRMAWSLGLWIAACALAMWILAVLA